MSQYSKIVEILRTLKDVDVEKVLSAVGDKIKVYTTLNYLSVHGEYVKELDQKENLCGAFSAAYILRGLGYKTYKNEMIDQDYIAYLARVNVESSHLEILRRLKKEMAGLPRGEAEELARKYRNIWYKFDALPTSQKPQELGASPEGIIHAIHEVTMSKLRAIPVKTCSKTEGNLLSEEKMNVFLNIMRRAEEYKAQFILNLNTRYLLDSEKVSRLSERLLLREEFEKIFRESVGHYVGCAGLIQVDNEALIIIRETYRKYGVHLQPAEYVRRALLREDGREGGIIIIAPRDEEGKLRNALLSNDFRIELWDNGSPFIPHPSQ